MEQYLTIKDVTERLKVDNSTIWRWRRAGQFPQGLSVGQTVRWKESEIVAWAEAQAK